MAIPITIRKMIYEAVDDISILDLLSKIAARGISGYRYLHNPNNRKMAELLDSVYGISKLKLMSNTFTRLENRNLFNFSESVDGFSYVTLSRSGIDLYNKLELLNYKPKKELYTSNRYLFVFDIKEENKYYRNLIRKKLIDLKVLRIQKSVYQADFDITEFYKKIVYAYPFLRSQIRTFKITK